MPATWFWSRAEAIAIRCGAIGIPALGLPGATQWNEARDAGFFDRIPAIYVVVEPDQGGETMRRRFAGSSILQRVRVLRLTAKDPSALHLAVSGNAERFRAALHDALADAEPYQMIADREAAAQADQDRLASGDLTTEQNILDRFVAALEQLNLVGEERNAKILYLALTSRLFARPVSVAVKGPSSGGKSHLVEVVLKFFPQSAYWSRTAMSERALAYSAEDFRHRHLVVFEAAGWRVSSAAISSGRC